MIIVFSNIVCILGRGHQIVSDYLQPEDIIFSNYMLWLLSLK